MYADFQIVMDIELLREIRRHLKGIEAAIDRAIERETAKETSRGKEQISVDREHKIIKMKIV